MHAKALLFLLPLFLGSGCAALIYEVVWLQLLQLVIGSSAVSLAVLLGTFMGGMCLGSLALPRLLRPGWHPLRVYAVLELGIAAAGILIPLLLPAVGELYTTLVGRGLPGLLLRATACAICLLPPTFLMGATLPAIARWVESTPRGVSWLGLFYGGNTLGAVAGCLLASFYLLRLHDGVTATLAAAALNLTVALLAFVLARRLPANPTLSPADSPTPATPGSSRALPVIAISGLCALLAEVVWTRQLSLLLGATVYTFSLILAVFLLGLGLGGGMGSILTRHLRQPLRTLALLQWLQAGAIAWAAHAIGVLLPQWRIDALRDAAPAVKFSFDLARCAWAIFPSALLWGASFPVALAALVTPGADSARLVGRAYAANTLGAIAGATLAGLLLIPTLGSTGAQALALLLSAAAAWLALRPRRPGEFALALGGAAAAALLAFSLPSVPWRLVAYGRQAAHADYGASPLYLGEGMNASVAVTATPDGARFFHVSGKTEASSLVQDMRLQLMLGHLPALIHPHPESVLIVGCGAGVTAGTFVLHPSIRRIVICDIEPLIPRAIATHFSRENHDVLRDPRVEIIHDDARHYIATTREKFDIITSDPIHPWVKGSAVLYSREYFELCRRRLKPGGLVTQWVPLYEADRDVVRSEIATFFSVFPHGTLWANDNDGQGYDTVLLGQEAPLRIDIDSLQHRLDLPEHLRTRAALTPLGLGSAVSLLATYAGRSADMGSWLAQAEINRDRDLRLQYLAGLTLDSIAGANAYAEILELWRFPTDIFHGSQPVLDRLRQAQTAALPP